MAEKVKLKVIRKKPEERTSEDVLDTVQEIIGGIGEGVFDAYLDIMFKAFDDRIRQFQEEDGDGELPTRDRADKLRSMRADRSPVTPVEGRHYRLRGEKYQGVVVMYLDKSGVNDRGAEMVLVEAITGNKIVTYAQQYKVPLAALEEIPDVKTKPLPDLIDVPRCRKCKEPVEYSGRGRPRALCDNCTPKTMVRKYHP